MAKWHNREAILAEFTSDLLKDCVGEDFAIDWSSSDEEVSHNSRVPVIEPPHLSTSINNKKKIRCEVNKAETYSSLKDHKYNKVHSSSTPSASDQKGPRLLASKQELSREKTPVSKVRNHEKLDLSQTESSLSVCTTFETCRAKNKTTTKESQIIFPSEATFNIETLSPNNEAYFNIFEPQSPVLGWRRTVANSCSPLIKAKKTKHRSCSPTFKFKKVPKRKLSMNNFASVKRQICSEDEKVHINFNFDAETDATEEETPSLPSDGNQCVSSDVNSNTNTWKLDDVSATEPDKHAINFTGTKDATQWQCTNAYSLLRLRSSRQGHSLSYEASDHFSEQIVPPKYESQRNSRISNSDVEPLASTDISPLQGKPESCIDQQASQDIAVTSEGTDSHVDYNIEMPLTHTKLSLDGTEVSQDIDFTEPHDFHDWNILQTEGSTRSGFDWVKHLQTPEKLPTTENPMDGIESCKKKLMKDGQAERLQQLLMSWRSDINIWRHEYSLTTLCAASPKLSSPLPLSVLQRADTISDVKLHTQKTLSEVKPLHSPVVRNLQDLLIENSASTPGSPSPYKISQKYLELKLLELGGLLPSNAALCEILDSNVDCFQTYGNVKIENAERTETEKTEKKFLVFFAVNEHNVTILCKFDTVKIYAPWQKLCIPGHDIPALFTSYFKFSPREKEPLSLLPSDRKTVHTWTCNCSNKTAPVSLCSVQSCSFPWVSSSQTGHTPPCGLNLGFTTVKDTPEASPKNGKLRAGTILEALEKCGGVSAVPVYITVRVHRTITRRKTSASVDAWELLGQDAAGQFCLVKIPNKPLAQDLKKVFSDPGGNNATYTFTHLTISRRLTNTQDPALFSLITSLHKAYQRTVLRDPHLQPLFPDLGSRPPQTCCYALTVSLGVTKLLNNEEQVTLPINLPHWSLHEAQTVACDGQRGSINVFALYKSDCSLYVVHPTLFSDEHEAKSSLKENLKAQTDILAWRVQLMVTVVPPWIPESGTVMVPAELRDVVVWHGNIVLDEYSSIELQKEAGTKINMLSLIKVLCPLSRLTYQECLTLVSGTISDVDEENSFIYLTCAQCKSDKVQAAEGDFVDCPWCDQRSTLPARTYSLEVWLDCGPDLQDAMVKVKLSEKTIEKLLSTCESHEGAYSPTTLLGLSVGPMACVVLELEQLSHSSKCIYKLAELSH